MLPKNLRRPLICAPVTGRAPLKPQLSAALKAGVDLIEVRLDTFAEIYISHEVAHVFSVLLLRCVRSACHKPILLTIRSPRERGTPVPAAERITDARRIALFKALLDGVDVIDVEAQSPALVRALTPLAHRKGKAVIHSYHDFRGPGRPALLNRLRAGASKAKADFFKAAVTPRTNDELESFLRWGKAAQSPRPILVGMGAVGLPSRFIGFSFGSAMTFGHLGQSTAPGQVPALELANKVRALYPVDDRPRK